MNSDQADVTCCIYDLVSIMSISLFLFGGVDSSMMVVAVHVSGSLGSGERSEWMYWCVLRTP